MHSTQGLNNLCNFLYLQITNVFTANMMHWKLSILCHFPAKDISNNIYN